MSTRIYYFSGTGNTLRVARSLKERLTDAEIIPIIPLLKSESVIPKTESVGIVFPIQSFSYPWVAAEFLNKLDSSRVEYIFAISSSHCFYKVFNDLEKVTTGSRKFDAYFVIEMPQNYIPMLKTPSPEQVKAANRVMEEALDSVAKVIRGRETHHHYEIKPTTEHHHLVCLGCGRVTEFEYPFTDLVKENVAEAKEFNITSSEIRMNGYCSKCQENRE